MISPLAYVDASAKLGANVTVHPFAYIDKNVEIGDDCEIMPHVSIMSGTRMGKRNRIFNGAVIAAEPQDFNYKGDDTIVEIGDDNVIRETVRPILAGRRLSVMAISCMKACMFPTTRISAITVCSDTGARFPATA